MRRYRAFGAGIWSELALPELTADADAPRDVSIVWGDPPDPPSRDIGFSIDLDHRLQRCSIWDGVAGAIEVSRERVVVRPLAAHDPQYLRMFVLGRAMGVLLHLRGLLVLHGSAVIGRRGVTAFLGRSGLGKSTLAAELYRRGYGIAADDIVAVATGGARPLALPGFPRVKLDPGSARAAGLDGADPNALVGKGFTAAPRGFTSDALPLRRVFVLTDGEQNAVEPLPAQQACIELVRRFYGAEVLEAAPAQARHLAQTAAVAEGTEVARLAVHHDRQQIPALIALLDLDEPAVASPS